MACLPAWIRFAQCLRRYRDSKEAFPHLVNAGKYASTFLVVIVGTLKNYYQLKNNYEATFDNPFVWAWLASSVFASCYAYTWDIKMDWGLFDKNAGENTLLREEIVYSSTVSPFICHEFQLNQIFCSSSITLPSSRTWRSVSRGPSPSI